jgi:small nuclear ribonucleoprotein (snRNP)-like protein
VCTTILTMNHRETPHPVTGILKGYDQLLNLVLDDVTEELQCALIQGFNENPSSLTLPNSPRTPPAITGFDCPPRSNDNRPQPSGRIRGDSQPLLAFRAVIISPRRFFPALLNISCVSHMSLLLLLLVNEKLALCKCDS